MKYIVWALSLFVCTTGVLHAQEVHQDLLETVNAKVLEIVSESTRDIVGTDSTALVQEVKVRIEEGEKKGDVVTFENDLTKLKVGDSIFVNRLVTIDGVEYYQFKDVNRLAVLAGLVGVLVLMLIVFSGKQGARAILSLVISVVAILYVLIPALLAGYPPVLASMAIAGVVLAVVLFLTHGIDARSVIAFVGTFGAVIITGFVATLWVGMARLTGFDSDASVYLNLSTHGALDFSALLLGSIIIGILGVLDDVAITQAAVVQELKAASPLFKMGELYRRAIRVGHDHIASLVNTLAFAYIGASLPLVLLLARTNAPLSLMVNQEIVAAEIVRIVVGSIGLILAVPLTTLIASWWYSNHDVSKHVAHSSHEHHHHH